MTQLFKSFVPVEFLDAWMRGDYVIGPRTLDYQYAGLALVLQGLYRYYVQKIVTTGRPHATGAGQQPDKANSVELFGGYAVAHIRDNELKIEGFRIYASDSGEQIPLFWKSVFSKFIEEESRRNLYFPYHTFQGRSASSNEHRHNTIKSLTSATSLGPQYLDKIESDNPSDLYELLSELCEDVVVGPAEQPQLRGLCVLTVPSGPRKSHTKKDANWDLELTGNNYGVYGSVNNPISGTVKFERLSLNFLNTLSSPSGSVAT